MKTNKKIIEMVICVSTLTNCYDWVELDLMNPTKAKSKYESFQKEHEGNKFIISDTSMTYGLGINEFDNIDFILDMAENYFSQWTEEQIKVFSDLVAESEFSWDYASYKVNNYDYMLIKHKGKGTEEEYVGRYYAEYLDIPEHFKQFLDYEDYGRNILEENENVTNDDYVIIVY